MSTLLRRGNGKPASLLRARLSFAMLLAICALLLGSGVVSAESPFRLPSRITDHNGSLGRNSAAVQTAITNLQTEDKTQLWVVFVDTFSGQAPATWVQQTTRMSGLGTNAAVLAVATGDGAYAFHGVSGFALDQAQLNTIAQNNIEPRLGGHDWSGAAVAAADGLRATIGGSSTSGSSSWILWVVLLALVIGGYLWYRSARKKSGARGGPHGSQGAQGATAADPAADGPPRNRSSLCSPSRIAAFRRSSRPTMPCAPVSSN